MKSPLFEDVDKIVRNAWNQGFRAGSSAQDKVLDRMFAKGMAIGVLLMSGIWISVSLSGVAS